MKVAMRKVVPHDGLLVADAIKSSARRRRMPVARAHRLSLGDEEIEDTGTSRVP